jgi:putative membrane protein
MRTILAKILIYALSIVIIAFVLPGITVRQGDLLGLVLFGVVMGLINFFIRPLVNILSCPLMFLSFGLFAFVINGFLLQLADWVSDSLTIDNFLWAMLGGFLMALIVPFLERLLGVERSSKRRRRR